VIDRRAFIASLAGIVVSPLAGEAQQPTKIARIGYLVTGSLEPPEARRSLHDFRQGLRDLGYVEGQSIAIEYRAADGRNERLPGLAKELIGLNVQTIVTQGTPAATAAKQSTSTIPIVMAIATDPVGAGLIASLGRPGGNVTGLANLDAELSGKRLEMLKAAVPALARVAVWRNPANPAHRTALREAEGAARALGVRVQVVDVRDPGEFDTAFSVMKRERADGLVLCADSMFGTYRTRILDLATRGSLPVIFWQSAFAEAGALMSYGTSYPHLFRRAAVYVDKILKGAKPADLPVEQPTTFELVINAKTAKALGLTIPQSILLRADQVIE
jgi:putative ABC transport system substrate-binding protein